METSKQLVPKHWELMRPILDLASKEPITRRIATVEMIKYLNLSDEAAKILLPSGGSTYISNRVGWAMTFLTKGKLIEKIEKFTYRATEGGLSFLKQHPEQITLKDMESIDGWKDAWKPTRNWKGKQNAANEESVDENTSPEELVSKGIEKIEDAVRVELVEYLLKGDPYRFEQVVLDLLVAMGYGGSNKQILPTKKSNDEGIDGVINQDKLGLDVIYVQAKRWQNSVGRKEIQSFVGALAGKSANKGIFITTSEFSDTAIEYAKNISQKVILIDGEKLTELMVEHDVGVSTNSIIKLKKIDIDYFEA